ncbi:hypothetical protein KFZ70_01905 [Tamlana fucoidanivorans]|uniref:Periplasmic heavy metal sensor n=1 Tax=Allotamlana fucoidanivorans TaxID=2583814 RepID=A0A5C4SG52_9FLAO|nr:hypothetical protein [Tamlana fucoidanivorans]TNJ42592.1 hypothetical protein FGF67_13960 [Tamlana fucoidanivorans]
MRKILVLVAAFISLQAVAQAPKKQGQRHKEGRQTMMNMSAEDMATLQTKKMTLMLDLTASQQTEIQKINLENATKRKAIMAEHKAKKESGLLQKPTQEEKVARMHAMLDHRIAVKAKMKKILDKEQYEKWEKAQKRMAMKMQDKKNGMQKRHAHKE